MEDAAAGGHPLDVARAETCRGSQAVAVIDRPGQHVRDRLDAAVRMPGGTRQIVLGPLVPEVVEEQKRIVVGRVALGIPRCSRTPAPSSVGDALRLS